ncbi:hypothetical protein C8R43DRAFT_1121163 [Mycena crocata]|nr:hypothetical protein C8R43DRAFT_1121163 [Mycena crocata]
MSSAAGFTYPSDADFPRDLDLSNPSYLQKIEDTTWYMTSAPASISATAHISRERMRITDIWAEAFENPDPGCDRADYSIFAALSFKDIRVGMLYFVVDGCDFVFETASEAYIMLQWLPDPFACIFVTSDKHVAECRAHEFKEPFE